MSSRSIPRLLRGPFLLTLPALAVLVLVMAVPLWVIVLRSFTDPEPGLENYERLFTSMSVQRVILTTLRICLITTVLSLLLGCALPYKVTMSGPVARRWWLLAVLVPLWISVLVRAFAWVTLLRRQGLINNSLMGAGVISEPLPLVWNEFGIIVGMVHYMVPFAVLPMLSSMREIDPRLLAAARGLGASRWEVFRSVFLPLSKPGILAAAVLVFIFSLGFYITPAILGGGRTIMVAEFISVQISETLRWGLAAMLATVLLGAVLLLVTWLSRFMDVEQALRK